MPARTQDDPAIVDSSAALASLYQAPLADFVSRRAALVSQLKRSGHKDVAARLASAGKPSRAAFLVNQVYWRARSLYDAVLETGTAARAAQQARLLGDAASDLADTMHARDAAIGAAVARAEQIGAEDDQPVREAIRSQVRASFEALAAHGLEGRVPHGHLTADVDLPGLAALAGLILPSTPPAPIRNFEVVARRLPPEPVAVVEVPPPDPRIVALEARLVELRGREQDAVERLADVERGLAASSAVLSQAEAAAAEAARQLAAARQAVARGERARVGAQAEATRLVSEREAVERELANLQQAPQASGASTGAAKDDPDPSPPRRSPAARRGSPAPAPRRPRG